MKLDCKSFLIILVLALLLTCCKKNNDSVIHLRGNVYDPNLNVNVSGAQIRISASMIQKGVYNSTYQDIAFTTTDASGNFRIDIAKTMAVGYKLTIVKYKYFSQQTDINPGDWLVGETYKLYYLLYPHGYIRIDVENITPFDNNDQVVYGFTKSTGDCNDCCKGTMYKGNGMSFKSTLKCINIGNKSSNFSWQYTKNWKTHIYDTSIYCKAFDTTYFKIQY